MVSISDDFADKLAELSVNTSRFEASVRRELLGLFHLLEGKLEREIRKARVGSAARIITRLNRQKELFRNVKTVLRDSYFEMAKLLRARLRSISQFTGETIVGDLNDVLGADLFESDLSSAKLRGLVGSLLVIGFTLPEQWSRDRRNTEGIVRSSLRQGILTGQNDNELVEGVLGELTGGRRRTTVNGRTRVFDRRSGGALQTADNKLRRLSRTAVHAASNSALGAVYEESAKLLRGLQAVPIMDARTSPMCVARAGASWDLESGDPLPESPRQEPFPGHPPWHHHCRTILIALLLAFEQLTKEATGARLATLRSIPPSVQARMKGIPAEDLSFGAWLEKQPLTKQRDILGPTRLKMWQNGELRLTDLVDMSGRPLTIEELRERRGLLSAA